MIEMLKKLFGAAEDQADTPADTSKTETKKSPPATEQGGIEEFVSFVVRSLVDEPDRVQISSEQDDSTTVIKISCEKKDIGKVIGKKGKTISAIRALANGAGGRIGQRVNVEVLD